MPAPPDSASAPLPPHRRSPPPPPASRSGPPSPKITSAPSPPAIHSALGVPTLTCTASVVVAVPSLTETVTVAVPLRPRAAESARLRRSAAPVRTSCPLGSRPWSDEPAVTTSAPAGESTSRSLEVHAGRGVARARASRHRDRGCRTAAAQVADEREPRAARGDDLAVLLQRDRRGAVIAATGVRRHLAAGTERRVEAAVRAVAGEREVLVEGVVALRAGGEAGDDDPAVGLHHDPGGDVVVTGEVGDHLAAPAEAGVQPAVRGVAGQGEVEGLGGTGDDDPPVRLERHRVGVLEPGPEVRHRSAGEAEAGVHAAVAVVAHEREVAGGRACDDDATVGLQDDGPDEVGPARDVGGDGARPAEGGVEPAVRQVAHEPEVATSGCRDDRSGHDDPPVGLHRDALGVVDVTAEVGGHPAAGAERRVQGAVGAVADQREIAARPGVVALDPRDDDPPVRLQGDRCRDVEVATEIGGHHAARAEGRVRTAVRAKARQPPVAAGRAARASDRHDPAVGLHRNRCGAAHRALDPRDPARSERRVQVTGCCPGGRTRRGRHQPGEDDRRQHPTRGPARQPCGAHEGARASHGPGAESTCRGARRSGPVLRVQRALQAQHPAQDGQRRRVGRVHPVVRQALARPACAPGCTACPRRSG